MISREGYRRGEENNPFKIVPGQPGRGTNISMLENDGSPLEKGPLFLQDNFGNFDIGIPGMQNINFTGDYVTETPINTRKAYDDLLKMLTHQGEKRKKVNAYGFLQGPKGNEPNIVGGAGIKFPGGFGIQGVGVLPTNNDPVFKGVGEAGINFDIGNLNLGANVGVPFLNDYNTGERLPFKPQPKLTAKFKFPTGGSVYDRYKFYKDKEGRSEEQSWWMAYNLPKAQDGNKGVVSDSTTLQMKDVRMQKMIAAIQAKIAAEEAAEAEKNKVVEAPVVEPVQVAPVQVAPIVNKPVVNPVVNKPVINKPVVNPVVNKPVIPPPVQTKPINIEDQKYPWFNKQIDFANPPTYDYQWNAGLENKDLELMPKGDNTRLFVSGVGYLGEHTPEVDPHYNPPSNNEKIANSYLDIELIDKKIQELTYISTNPKSGESIEQAKEEITQLNKKRNDNVQRINEAKKDEAGFFDSWVSEAWSPSLSKPLEKYGIIDQYSPAILNQPKFETYTEKVEKERKIAEVARETRITTNSHDEISPSNNKWHRWQYRTSASNDDPLTVQLYGTRGEREGKNLNIKSKGSIMHFLDQSPISGYMNRKTQVFYENAKPDDYFGYLRKNVDGTHNVLYLKRKDIPAGDLYQKTFLIRQNDFDDINFSGRATDANFAGHTYWTLKSTGKNAIPISAGKDRNTYDYSSGQSVVYIFPYKGETRYIHFAGSPNSIEKEGDKINKRYKLKKNVLKLGVADAGSYSSSVKGNITNNLLNSKDYGYYNMNSNTGAGMALIKKLGGELPKAQSGKFNLGVRPINLHLDKWDKQDSYFTATGAGAGLLASVPNLVKNYKVDQLSEYMCGPGYTCPSGIGKGNQDLFIDPANTQLGYNEPVEGNVGKAWGNLALNTALGGVTGWATSKLYDKIRG